MLLRVYILNALKRWEDATIVGEGALRHYPRIGQLYLATAYAKRRSRNIPEAKAILLAGESVLNEEAAFHFNLACYECQLGNVLAAKERLKRAFDLDPGFREVALDDADLEPFWVASPIV